MKAARLRVRALVALIAVSQLILPVRASQPPPVLAYQVPVSGLVDRNTICQRMLAHQDWNLSLDPYVRSDSENRDRILNWMREWLEENNLSKKPLEEIPFGMLHQYSAVEQAIKSIEKSGLEKAGAKSSLRVTLVSETGDEAITALLQKMGVELPSSLIGQQREVSREKHHRVAKRLLALNSLLLFAVLYYKLGSLGDSGEKPLSQILITSLVSGTMAGLFSLVIFWAESWFNAKVQRRNENLDKAYIIGSELLSGSKDSEKKRLMIFQSFPFPSANVWVNFEYGGGEESRLDILHWR